MEGYIFQLNCSDGGVPKRSVGSAELTETGLVGDRQAHTKIHGGPERALCLYALENIERLQGEGHPIFPGSVGENVTVAGLDWKSLEPGNRLALGDEVVVEITSYAGPCQTIAGSFAGGKFKRISQKINPGESRLYARVVQAGRLEAGQKVKVLNGAEANAKRGASLWPWK
ncbi:MAG TPA: MOSC domain-containing protein [Pyrinomonadaceae bacterium]|nr:MOSC domain-containing protein [Pyrinomonadaceae bacterium]